MRVGEKGIKSVHLPAQAFPCFYCTFPCFTWEGLGTNEATAWNVEKKKVEEGLGLLLLLYQRTAYKLTRLWPSNCKNNCLVTSISQINDGMLWQGQGDSCIVLMLGRQQSASMVQTASSPQPPHPRTNEVILKGKHASSNYQTLP